jgi:hypothetical protein
VEVAQELGVPLSDSYNGNLTSAQNGSVGGYMVKNMSPEMNIEQNHTIEFPYRSLTVTYHMPVRGYFFCKKWEKPLDLELTPRSKITLNI